MGLREKINGSPTQSLAVVVVALLAAVVVLWWTRGGGSEPVSGFFYDTDAGVIRIGDAVGPAALSNARLSDDGAAGTEGTIFYASIYTCGDPPVLKEGMSPEEVEAAGAFIGVLHRTEDGRQYVADPMSLDWVGGESVAASRLYNEINAQCAGLRPARMMP